MFLQEAGDRIRVVAVHVHVHGGVGIGGTFKHRTDQPGRERGQELHRAQRGLAPPTQARHVRLADEQALVLAQCVLDFAVAGQGSIVVGMPSRLAALSLASVVADAALGHQPGGFVRQSQTALAGAGFGVSTGVVHGKPRVETGPECTPCPALSMTAHARRQARFTPARQKMSNASSSGTASSGPYRS